MLVRRPVVDHWRRLVIIITCSHVIHPRCEIFWVVHGGAPKKDVSRVRRRREGGYAYQGEELKKKRGKPGFTFLSELSQPGQDWADLSSADPQSLHDRI